MTSVQVTSKVELNQLIEGVAQLETTELETFAEQVSLLLAQRRTKGLSDEETELFRNINRSLSTEAEERYIALQDKVHDETITPAEHQELSQLVSIVEQADADRLQALIRLSQIRQVSLPELMQQLGIQPPPLHA